MVTSPLSEDNAALMAYADSLQATAEKVQSQGPALQKRAMQVQVTETSPDGLVSVTVGARGDLVRLDIDPRVFRRPDSRALADTITETIHRAGDKAREQVLDVFEELVPRDQMAMNLDGDLDAITEKMTRQIFGRE